MDNNVIIREAKEYISNDKTLSETAKVLGVSKKTLQLHFKELAVIDSKLSMLVEKKKSKNQVLGRIKGGALGKVTSSYEKEQILVIAKTIIRNELTYEEASLMFDIPKSTIYGLVHSDVVPKDIKDALDVVGYSNKVKSLVSDLGKKNGK